MGTCGDVKEYAEKFYNSKAWKDCRAAYRKSVRGLCERCLAQGIINTGEIVHHREPISADNINNPNVILDWKNLELVCRSCHSDLHYKERARRYKLDELGRVIIK